MGAPASIEADLMYMHKAEALEAIDKSSNKAVIVKNNHIDVSHEDPAPGTLLLELVDDKVVKVTKA